jgi:AAA family ATP:ADP antiporter
MSARRRRGLFALAMAANFFLIVTAFWVLKPLKKGLFVRTYDATGLVLAGVELTSAQAELVAKVANLGVAVVAAVAFTALARRARRQRLAMRVTAFFLAGHALFAWLLRAPGEPTVWAFYLYGDLWSTAMVASFFAFLNDAVSPDDARRLYGPIGLGGVLGGLAGSGSVATLLARFELSAWLGICFALCVAILALWAAAGRLADPGPAPPEPARAPELAAGTSALAAVRRVARSRYCLSLVAIVGLYEIASTLLDFQFTATVAGRLDGDAIDAHFARVFAITNATALTVQLVGTPLVLARLGVGAGLLVAPGAALAAQAAFAAAPALSTGSALSIADNGLNYSIQQSAREALYVPLDRAEKYQAKAVIDIFVQRFAKVLAIALSLGLALGVGERAGLRWLALPSAVVLAAWLACARYSGREFERRVREGAE